MQGAFELGYDWGDWELDLGGGVSVEDDYTSRFVSAGASWDLDEGRTNFNLVLSFTDSETTALLDHDAVPYIDTRAFDDQIHISSSSGDRTLDGDRNDWGAQLGVTQVVSKNALIETSVAYARNRGYMENPYKVVEVGFIDPEQQFLAPPGGYYAQVHALLEQRRRALHLHPGCSGAPLAARCSSCAGWSGRRGALPGGQRARITGVADRQPERGRRAGLDDGDGRRRPRRADYARVRTDDRLVGVGATGRQIAVYFGDGDQMHDFRTLQDHAAPDDDRPAVQGRGPGPSPQRVHGPHPGAAGARPAPTPSRPTATSSCRDEAWAECVPNLEIENNDVRCSHASTVGPIDEEQRFYLESRGVPRAVAERLIVIGFFDEVLDRLPVPHLATGLRPASPPSSTDGRLCPCDRVRGPA